MIIRDRQNDFVMIQQHDHAQISKYLYEHLLDIYLPEETVQSSIGYAIGQHDCGWIPFDETPFWDDKKLQPYAFTDFPTEPKTVLYRYGINQVEEKDPYAALLCSEHYTRFLSKSSQEHAQIFVQQENARRRAIEDSLNVKKEDWLPYYEVLQFFDNLSLYICLNEPGTAKDKEHFFFHDGIRLPSLFAKNKVLHPKWTTEHTIQLDLNLFKSEVTVKLKQKIVSKEVVDQKGVQQAYEDAEKECITIKVN